MINMITKAAKYVVEEVVDTSKNVARFAIPASVPGLGYFLEMSEKIPELPQDEKLFLAGAFGAATILAVDLGQEVGQKTYEAARSIAPPADDFTERAGCVAGNFICGMGAAALATTLAFNFINDHPERLIELDFVPAMSEQQTMPENN